MGTVTISLSPTAIDQFYIHASQAKTAHICFDNEGRAGVSNTPEAPTTQLGTGKTTADPGTYAWGSAPAVHVLAALAPHRRGRRVQVRVTGHAGEPLSLIFISEAAATRLTLTPPYIQPSLI